MTIEAATGAPGKRTILLAEDNVPSAEVTTEILHELGYHVIVAGNGEEAIALATKHQPNLILMDVQMPVMDGLTATRLLKQDPATTGIPVICLTAFAMEKDVAICMEAGAVLHLSKPMDYMKLDALLNKYCR